MKRRHFLLAAFLLAFLFSTESSTANAATIKQTETYLKYAEAGSKKLAVQITYKGNPALKEPDNKTFVTTRDYLNKTKAAVKTLSKTTQIKYSVRIKNVETILIKTTAFRGAVYSSRDLAADLKIFNTEYKLNPWSDKTKKAYDTLIQQIIQSDLAYRKVYDSAARTAFYTKYLRPAQAAATPYTKNILPIKKEIDAVTKEMIALEAAVKNHTAQAEIDRLTQSIQAKLLVLKHPATVASIKQRLFHLKDGYQILAQASLNDSITVSDMAVDEANGYLYVISEHENRLYIYSTKNLALVKEMIVQKPVDLELYEGKLYVAANPTLVINPKALSAQPETLRIYNAKNFIVHKNHIYYLLDETWSKIHDYNLSTKYTTLIEKPGAPFLDYEFAGAAMGIDRVKDILYLGDHRLTAIDLKTNTILSRDNYDHDFGGGPLFYENGSVFFSSMRFNASDLTKMEGTYPAGYPRDVIAVKGNYVFSPKAVFNRNTFTKVRDLPLESDRIVIDSGMNIYGFNWADRKITKMKVNILPLEESDVQTAPNQLVFKNNLTDWVYDESNDKIYGISRAANKLFYINARTLQVEKEVIIGSEPTDIEMYGDQIYVGLLGAHKIAVASKNPASPISYIYTATTPGLIEIASDKIFYRSNGYNDYHDQIYMYDRATRKSELLFSKIQNPNQYTIQNTMEADFKLDPNEPILYVNDNHGQYIYSIRTDTLEVIKQSPRDVFKGNGELFVDEYGLYYSTHFAPKDHWDAIEAKFNSPVIQVGKEYIFTQNALYEKSTFTRVADLKENWHSAYINAQNEVFLLNEEQKLLKKFTSVEEVPKQ